MDVLEFCRTRQLICLQFWKVYQAIVVLVEIHEHGPEVGDVALMPLRESSRQTHQVWRTGEKIKHIVLQCPFSENCIFLCMSGQLLPDYKCVLWDDSFIHTCTFKQALFTFLIEWNDSQDSSFITFTLTIKKNIDIDAVLQSLITLAVTGIFFILMHEC